MRQPKYDCIIVGAGPAGVTAAAVLGRQGLSVLLLEAAVYPGAENWSGAVYFTEVLEDEDVFGADGLAGAPFERRLVRRGLYATEGVGLLGLAVEDRDVFRSCHTVLRPVFDRFLAEKVREFGVTLVCETTVQSLIRDRGRVVGVHTERGPAYAEVVFLAEGDASHLVTQEGYERPGVERPSFLQGVKEVIHLGRAELERRFGLTRDEGAAYEILVRNAHRDGEVLDLNLGAFLYTNLDSVSVGYVLPVDNLARHWDGDHAALIDWLEGLEVLAPFLEGGQRTSYGAKVIRGGGFRQIPRLVDDGLAIGGAASGIGLDFPYPNFTGPATLMGRLFAGAVLSLREEGLAPTAAALEARYLGPLRASHHYRNVEFLRDWPEYVESTRHFFSTTIDLSAGAAYVLTRPERTPWQRWNDLVRIVRRALPAAAIGSLASDLGRVARLFGVGRVVLLHLPRSLVAWTINSMTGLIRTGWEAEEGFRIEYRVGRGSEPVDEPPLLVRWPGWRLVPGLAQAAKAIYTNDETPLADRLRTSVGAVLDRLAWLDLAVAAVTGVALVLTALGQRLVERLPFRLRTTPADRHREAAEAARSLDDRPGTAAAGEARLSLNTYLEGHDSHIQVFWPPRAERARLIESPLFNVCPARVYDGRPRPGGLPAIVVNFDNCIKCETCWRASDDVHWSRATTHRLIYETYSPSQRNLLTYLENRLAPEPTPPAVLDRWDLWIDAHRRAAARFLDGPTAGMALLPSATVRLSASVRRARWAVDGLARAATQFGRSLAGGPRVVGADRAAWLAGLARRAAALVDQIGVELTTSSLARFRSRLDAESADHLFTLHESMAAAVARFDRWADAGRFFWIDVALRQLVDHHVLGLRQALDVLARRLGDGPAAPPVGPVDRTIGGWRARVRQRIESRVDRAAIRAAEAGRRGDLGELLDELLTEADRGPQEGYGRVEVLIEELSRVDPSLGVLVAGHLAAVHALTRLGGGQAVGDLVEGRQRAILVPGPGALVPTALVERFAIVDGDRVRIVGADHPGLDIRPVRTTGLRSAAFGAVDLDCDRGDVDTVLPVPEHSDPEAVRLAGWARGLLAVALGAGELLRDRAIQHALDRVQFGGQFIDEGGRDGIAKFGAVKRMISRIEAHRLVLETLSTRPGVDFPAGAADALRRLIAARALGPEEGSIAWDAGQVFGGTAYSEDDVLARFYRDSAILRYAGIESDVARRRIAASRIEDGAAWRDLVRRQSPVLDRAGREGILAGAAERLGEAERILADWTADLVGLDDADAERLLLADAVADAFALRTILVEVQGRFESGADIELEVALVRMVADALVPDVRRAARMAAATAVRIDLGGRVLDGQTTAPPSTGETSSAHARLLLDPPAYDSGQYLLEHPAFDRPRYTPETVAGDGTLSAFARATDAFFRETFREPTFDGLEYGRHLEVTHRVPDAHLAELERRGHFRMFIPRAFGGEGLPKAYYYLVVEAATRWADPALGLIVQANSSIGTTPILIGLRELDRAERELSGADEAAAGRSSALRYMTRRRDLSPAETRALIAERLAEIPRQRRAAGLGLSLIAAGHLSAFALTEPTAGSDSGGVKTVARFERRTVHREDGVLAFYLDEENRRGRRVLVDAAGLAVEGRRLLYRPSDGAPPGAIHHEGYDYETDDPKGRRWYESGGRRVEFDDIGLVRTIGGRSVYEYYALSGAKMWITNGRVARLFVLYALTEHGVTGFLVDRHAEGLVVGADEEKLGQQGSPTNELSLDQVRVAAENLIGIPGRGQVNALETLNVGRTGIAMTAVGVFGDIVHRLAAAPPVADPATRLRIGRVVEELIASQSIAYELVGLMESLESDRGTRSVRMESAIAKQFASESIHRAIADVEDIRGLAGSTDAFDIEKKRRDQRVLPIYEGTNEVQRYLVLKDLVDRIDPAHAARPGPGGIRCRAAVFDGSRRRLLKLLDEAVRGFGKATWQEVAAQSVFFDLAEMASWLKVMESVLHRVLALESEAAGGDAEVSIVRAAGEVFVERAAAELERLEGTYRAGLAHLIDGRLPPAARAADVAFDRWTAPGQPIAPPPPIEVQRTVTVVVAVKPIRVLAPRPRLEGGHLTEPLFRLSPADRRALAEATRWRAAGRRRVQVIVATVGPPWVEDALRQALAAAGDRALHVLTEEDQHDALASSRWLAAALRETGIEPDLVLTGDRSPEDGQGLFAPALAETLGADHVLRARSVRPVDDGEAAAEVGLDGHDAGEGVRLGLPLVAGFAPGGEESGPTVARLAWAAGEPIQSVPAADDIEPVPVRHLLTGAPSPTEGVARVFDPAGAARLLLEVVGRSGSRPRPVPYRADVQSMPKRPTSEGGAVLAVLSPATVDGIPADWAPTLRAARLLAAAAGSPLDVAILSDRPVEALDEAVGFVADHGPQGVYLLTHPAMARFGYRGHIEALTKFLARYPESLRYLVGPVALDEVLARLAVSGALPDRPRAWLSIGALDRTGSTVSLRTPVHGGATEAEVRLPVGGAAGVQVVSVRPDVVCLEMPAARSEPTVYHKALDLRYRPEGDALAARARPLPNGLPGAEFVIDVGYGVGTIDGLDRVVRPLERLLKDEMGLARVAVGATRKVTQDLRLLPDDHQIGQTGVRVDPSILIALGVSGAPQHVDSIGRRAVVLAFNKDPDAPLLLSDRTVHPIVGDLFETVPAFVDALRQGLEERPA